MDAALPIHPWRHRLTQVWCCWWCSIDFPSNCCTGSIFIFCLKILFCWFNQLNEGPISLCSCPEKPKKFQMKSSLRMSVRPADWGQRGIGCLLLKTWQMQGWKRRTWRQMQLVSSRNIPPWFHWSAVCSFIQHLYWAPTTDWTPW